MALLLILILPIADSKLYIPGLCQENLPMNWVFPSAQCGNNVENMSMSWSQSNLPKIKFNSWHSPESTEITL